VSCGGLVPRRSTLGTVAGGILAAVVLASTNVPPSSADGDPASDVLPAKDVFFPYQPNVSAALEAATERTVHAASAAGFPLKVAIIRTALELGLVQNLFGRAQAYAQFLDREISFNQPRQLLVVMPSGYGVMPARLAGALAGVPVDRRHGSDGLTRSAIRAVVALARSQGYAITAAPISSSSSAGSPPALLVFGLPAVLLALLGSAMARRRRSGPSRR
jgi:hypothetical protein